MELVIISIIIIIVIFFIFKKYNKKKYDDQNEEVETPGQFYCDNFSYTWNAVSEKEDNIELTFEVNIKSPYDFTLIEYILFCGISINKNYNFYSDEPRWGYGTTYGDWWPKDTKQIKGSVSIPKQDFKNTPQELYFYVSFKGRGKLPVEKIASFKLPVSKWHDVQKELAAKP